MELDVDSSLRQFSYFVGRQVLHDALVQQQVIVNSQGAREGQFGRIVPGSPGVQVGASARR